MGARASTCCDAWPWGWSLYFKVADRPIHLLFSCDLLYQRVSSLIARHVAVGGNPLHGDCMTSSEGGKSSRWVVVVDGSQGHTPTSILSLEVLACLNWSSLFLKEHSNSTVVIHLLPSLAIAFAISQVFQTPFSLSRRMNLQVCFGDLPLSLYLFLCLCLSVCLPVSLSVCLSPSLSFPMTLPPSPSLPTFVYVSLLTFLPLPTLSLASIPSYHPFCLSICLFSLFLSLLADSRQVIVG